MAFVLPGGVNEPPVTASAAVMVVSGSDRAARRSHDGVGVCAPSRPPRPEIRISSTPTNRPSDIQKIAYLALLLEFVQRQSTADGLKDVAPSLDLRQQRLSSDDEPVCEGSPPRMGGGFTCHRPGGALEWGCVVLRSRC